jgi:general secretion pathway protein G
MHFIRFNRRVVGTEAGMTLIEIMVVIVIIAGLMTVLGSNVMEQFNKSKFKNSEIQMRNITTAVQAYELDCGQPPTEEFGLESLVADPGREVCVNWGPQSYLSKAQLKDAYGHPFVYELADGVPILTFLGRDGRPGGKGFDRDVSSEDASSRTQADLGN